jgi:hypothetical protein
MGSVEGGRIVINEVERLRQKERLKELFLAAMLQAESELLELREQSVHESVNKPEEEQLDLEHMGPGDFTPEQLSEARRLFLHEGFSDADALRKVREDQDG